IKDIPPVTDTGLRVDRPEIYYGEHDNSYAITNTSIKPGEFDYPSGDENKYTTYAGTGGIKLDSLFTRLMAAITFGDINLLISGNISNESRLLFRRNIVEIAKSYAPFIELDDDPYLVLSEGRLYWMIDGYTTSDRFPYSTPVYVGGQRINYIRNSVKLTIDAYNGTISCYISDKNDPVIQVYNRIFPGILKDIKEMPADLQKHIRYPEDIFNIQSHILLRYHMTNPNVFYNSEDAWQIPSQIYGDREEAIHSYYLVTKLPGEKQSGFLLIMPFSPYKKMNMLAFLTAKCDPEEYGRLQLFQLPKERLSYGPM
ncbi:MAG: COG1615 family transporter, partial [Spirochaetes bacterium]|nr:COG1615 family transporter [Spirochaetota bacterium]